MLNLGIRVSTQTSLGRGHLERCLTIRSQINKKVFWFVDFETNFIKNKISKLDEIFYENGANKFSFLKKSIKNNLINCVLVDSYKINIKEIHNISKKIPIITLIDKNINIRANLIICPQPIDIDYREGCKYLSGPKYAPISSKYVLKNKIKKINNKILISFGAYDSKGLTLNTIKAIKNLLLCTSYNFISIIALAKESPILNKVKALIENDSSFKLILDTKNMGRLYKDCDIAIGAPGLSHLERLGSGIPSILVPQNKIHTGIIDRWVKLGCAIKADNSVNSIENNLNLFLSDNSLQKKIFINGKNFVDGKGAKRIVAEINKLVNIND